MLNATVGQIFVNEALPEDLRDYNRTLDGPAIKSLLQNVARNHPDKYRDVSYRLNQVGLRAAQEQGGMSFGARHLLRSKVANETRERIQGKLKQILANDSLSDKDRAEQIVKAVGSESMPQIKAVLEEAIQNKNPLGTQVMSGTRGKAMNLASLIASDMLYSDHHDEVIPIPVLRSYSEGLSPEEYWAGTYGARRGIMSTKFATQEAGFLSKQLNQAGHRLVVMGEEPEEEAGAPLRGMIADTDDSDNEGSLLAADTGPYKKNTPLTPKVLNHLKRLGKNRILVRSPIIGGSPEGGVYARDVGIRENGALPGRGEQVGLQAAQALSEPISQGQLSAKHSGGVAGQEKAVGGFQYINQLIQTPKKMQGGAAHSTLDGRVQRIEPAPAGGHNVIINGQKHYVGEGFDLKVKQGDDVEAGDMISDGIPNPAIITQYKGVGEGRRYFVNEFRKAMANSGMRGHRRNIELLARGLINHVKLTEETDDHVPDDVIPYSTLEHTYKPRAGHEILSPKKAIGQYLERPVLHYTIGTKIRPSMLKDFDEFGVSNVVAHKNPPPFEPHMVRGMYQLQHDPDWLTQMYGSGLKQSLLDSAARGATSEARGTSFVSSLATGNDFGEVPDRAVIQPQKPYPTPNVPLPKIEEPAMPKLAFFGGKFKPTIKSAVQATPPAPKAPSPTTIPAPTANTPRTNPSSANQVFDNNIMPTAPTSLATGIPNVDPGSSALTSPKSTDAPISSSNSYSRSNATSQTTVPQQNYYDDSQNYLPALNSYQQQNFYRNVNLLNNGFSGPSRLLATSNFGSKDNLFSSNNYDNLTQPQQNFVNSQQQYVPNQNNQYAASQVNQNNVANEQPTVDNNSNSLIDTIGSGLTEIGKGIAAPIFAYNIANKIAPGLAKPTPGVNPTILNSIKQFASNLYNKPLATVKSIGTKNLIGDALLSLYRKPSEYLNDHDAYQKRMDNLAQGVHDTFTGISQGDLSKSVSGLGSSLFEGTMTGLGIISQPYSFLRSGIQQHLFEHPEGTHEGDLARRLYKAENYTDTEDLPDIKKPPETWDYIKGFGVYPPHNPVDPDRTTWQSIMPYFLGGKDKPDPVQFQTPENQEKIRFRQRFDALGPQGQQKLVTELLKNNDLDTFSKFSPNQLRDRIRPMLPAVLTEIHGQEQAKKILEQIAQEEAEQAAQQQAADQARNLEMQPKRQIDENAARRIGGARNY